MKSDCELVRNRYGYTDAMTDEPLDECKRCEHWEKNDSLYKALFEDGE